ncbi:MAG: UDP-galactopyranose mutase [Flavobacterium sp.]|nr:UDP-galactopyranose mutase [Flavobacterium sp.]
MYTYDYLIIGTGLYGATFAHFATKEGKKCLIIDKRNHKGGNIFCKNIEGINVHKYGAHIFHTNDQRIWNFVNSFSSFNRYTNSPLAISKGKLYNLPFNMNTFHQLWGVITPQEAIEKLMSQTSDYEHIKTPKNLEEQALKLVGKDVYETLIKEYTEKQWGKKGSELPAFIIKRLPIRYTYDNNYFSDKYQGIPNEGYNQIINKLLKGIEVQLNTDYFKNIDHFSNNCAKIVFTGAIDEYFNYKFGKLEYRSLVFENKLLEQENFQGNAVVNYIDKVIPYTRIIEHKHFEFGTQKQSVITYEYPTEWSEGKEPYYPVNDTKNTSIYKKYETLAHNEVNTIFGGRLAEYKYYDMHQVIASAFNTLKNHFHKDFLKDYENYSSNSNIQ